ncbi:unnamed protein product [Pleuronectes platessa]|uniref:Uncharacterized protein n=1 Tax=Pleuronectes platessa TaxID=8262 RepID=A0A9N7TTI7_PLEPL|nr:unnamed protein product [Pleuronectes platessa]
MEKENLSNQANSLSSSSSSSSYSSKLSKGGKVPKKEPRQSASMRAAKNDDGGTVIFLLQLLVIFCGHTLACHSPPMCTHHRGRIGNRLITVASARGDVSPRQPFPANNYAEVLAFDGALRDFEVSHENLPRACVHFLSHSFPRAVSNPRRSH